MTRAAVVWLVLAGISLLGVAACSGDNDDETTPTTKTSGRSTPGCKSTDDSSPQRMTVEPCTDLVEGQTVRVYASAFTSGVEVEVTLCAAGSAPGGAGCDTNDVRSAEIGAGGAVVVDYQVKKVLSGKDPVNCTAARCVLTLGEADRDGERADPVAVTFAP